jgi:hypothetical protein
MASRSTHKVLIINLGLYNTRSSLQCPQNTKTIKAFTNTLAGSKSELTVTKSTLLASKNTLTASTTPLQPPLALYWPRSYCLAFFVPGSGQVEILVLRVNIKVFKNANFFNYRFIDYQIFMFRQSDYRTMDYQPIDHRTKKSDYRTIDYRNQEKDMNIDAQLLKSCNLFNFLLLVAD